MKFRKLHLTTAFLLALLAFNVHSAEGFAVELNKIAIEEALSVQLDNQQALSVKAVRAAASQAASDATTKVTRRADKALKSRNAIYQSIVIRRAEPSYRL